MSNAWVRNVLVLAFTAVCVIAVAQEKTQEKPLEAKGNPELKVTSESRGTVKGRLPRYFASLVNSEQRIEIYLIQAKFRDQISELKQQLEKLESKQMQDIEAVLTTGQREKLFDFRNSSRNKQNKAPTTEERRDPTEASNDSSNQTSIISNK
jgi:hypothetical protein